MITYELAEKLRAAKFNPKGGFRSFVDSTKLYAPDLLTEMIEACRPAAADDFMLRLCGKDWEATLIYHGYFEGWPGAGRDKDGFVDIDITELGEDPEEAVAKLLIKLNYV